MRRLHSAKPAINALTTARVRHSSQALPWQSWDQRATQVVQTNMNGAARRYLHAYDEGHPYLGFLAAQLGFRFDLQNGKISVPSMASVIQRLSARIATSGLPRNEAIYPARLAVLPSGQKVAVFPGEEPTTGSTVPIRLLSGDEWLRFLAKGIGVIDEPEPLQPHQSYLEHSLVHNVSFARYLPYMSMVRYRARQKVRRLGRSGELDDLFNQRLYMTTEILDCLPQSAQPSLIQTADIPSSWEPTTVRFDDVFKRYRCMTSHRFARLADDVHTWLRFNGEVIGAVYGTPVHPHHTAWQRARNTDRRDLLARAVTWLLRISEIPPERFAAEALEEPLNPASAVCDLFTRSGIFTGQFSYWSHVFAVASQ